MKKFIRNPVCRFVICFVICVSLVSMNVVYPLTVPVQAIAPLLAEALAWVVQGILIGLGVNLALDYENTTEGINSVVFSLMDELQNNPKTITPMTEAGEKLVALWEEQDNDPLFDPPINSLTIDMSYADWMALETVASAWLVSHLVPSGGGYVVKIESDPNAAPPAQVIRHIFDNFNINVTDRGKVLNECLSWVDTCSSLFPADSIRWCLLLGKDSGNGYSSCYFVAFAGDLSWISGKSGYSPKPRKGGIHDIYLLQTTIPRSLSLTLYSNGNSRAETSSVNGNYVYLPGGFASHMEERYWWGNFDLPAMLTKFGYPLTGTQLLTISSGVSVPAEKDDRFAPGIVTGAWGDLIGRVGDIAGSLPLTFPTSPAGFQDLSQSGATSVFPDILTKEIVGEVDVPAEGDVNLPDVGDLKLPATLVTKFPFCIPFDAMKGLSLLSASPVSPRFKIPFKFGKTIDYTIDIDFDRFSRLISIIRWFEIAIFTALLMVNTRKFIKW